MVLVSIATFVAGSAGIYNNVIDYDGDAPYYLTKNILASGLLGISTIISVILSWNPGLFSSIYFPVYFTAYITSFVIALVLAFLGGVILNVF